VYFIHLKTWLRSITGQHRLTGLALQHVHTNIIVSIDETINKFTKMKKWKFGICYLITVKVGNLGNLKYIFIW
jgi:hypothetical protein